MYSGQDFEDTGGQLGPIECVDTYRPEVKKEWR